jgi:hypothetical protein
MVVDVGDVVVSGKSEITRWNRPPITAVRRVGSEHVRDGFFRMLVIDDGSVAESTQQPHDFALHL